MEKGLAECVFAVKGLQVVSGNMLATVLQALLGAVFCDGGYEALERIIGHLEMKHVYLAGSSQALTEGVSLS